MKYLNILLFVALIGFTGYSCTDLSENLEDGFTEDFDPNNPGYNDIPDIPNPVPNDGLTEAYSRTLNAVANHGSYFSVSEISTDEVVVTQKGGDWFDGGIWLNMHRHDFLPTNPGLNGAWTDLYGGVSQTNLLLESGLDANQTAQLRVLRAYFHWKLADLFGRIKIIDSSTGGEAAPQVDRPEVFQWVVDEVNAAIPDLAENNGYSRINLYTAHAFLSRLYLNGEVYTRPYPYTPGTGNDPVANDYYQMAIDHADEVINSGLYDLDPSFESLFGPANLNSIEHIFVAPFDAQTGTGMNFAQMTLHYPSQLTYDLQEQPWNGYSTLEEFYNSYDDGDDRKEAFFIAGPQFDQNGNPILDVAFDEDDPDGAPVNYTPFINELAPNGSRQAGARMGKFSFRLGQGNEMDNDYTLIRYAEVLMNKAEAEARLAGDWNLALPTVNLIRDRANATPLGSITADEFLAERGREFFQESLRRTDLIRFGAWGDAWWEKDAHSSDFKNVMPIPLDQINATTNGSLTQHADY